jgi:hypothetical protein
MELFDAFLDACYMMAGRRLRGPSGQRENAARNLNSTIVFVVGVIGILIAAGVVGAIVLTLIRVLPAHQ